MEVKLSAPEIMTDRPTNRPTDQGLIGEVSLPNIQKDHAADVTDQKREGVCTLGIKNKKYYFFLYNFISSSGLCTM